MTTVPLNTGAILSGITTQATTRLKPNRFAGRALFACSTGTCISCISLKHLLAVKRNGVDDESAHKSRITPVFVAKDRVVHGEVTVLDQMELCDDEMI